MQANDVIRLLDEQEWWTFDTDEYHEFERGETAIIEFTDGGDYGDYAVVRFLVTGARVELDVDDLERLFEPV